MALENLPIVGGLFKRPSLPAPRPAVAPPPPPRLAPQILAAPPPVPTIDDVTGARDEKRKKLQKRKIDSSTVLTGGLGAPDTGNIHRPSILGTP